MKKPSHYNIDTKTLSWVISELMAEAKTNDVLEKKAAQQKWWPAAEAARVSALTLRNLATKLQRDLTTAVDYRDRQREVR